MRLAYKNTNMTTIDLMDDYFLISVDDNDLKYLRFKIEGHLYQFTCLHFGLSSKLIYLNYETSRFTFTFNEFINN